MRLLFGNLRADAGHLVRLRASRVGLGPAVGNKKGKKGADPKGTHVFGRILEVQVGIMKAIVEATRRVDFRLAFGSNFGASWRRFRSLVGRISGSNFNPRKVS